MKDLNMKGKVLNRAIITISLLGVLLSTYAMYVEILAELKPGYKAMCDISDHASCSRVLTSKYAKGLGLLPEGSPFKVPNCVYGIIFYCIIIFLTTYDQVQVVQLQLGFSAASLLICVYLAYLLIFVLQDFCLVCVTTYGLNIANTFLLKNKYDLLATKNK